MCLEDYIRRNGLSPNLVENLIRLIQDFKSLGFTRLDIRCSHIFVQDDESVMIIDPRDHYITNVPYPKKMLSRLKELKVGKIFFDTLKDKYPSLYNEWKGMRSV
jgi:hypothetical protein